MREREERKREKERGEGEREGERGKEGRRERGRYRERERISSSCPRPGSHQSATRPSATAASAHDTGRCSASHHATLPLSAHLSPVDDVMLLDTQSDMLVMHLPDQQLFMSQPSGM